MKSIFLIILTAIASGSTVLSSVSAQDVAAPTDLSPAEQAQAGDPPKPGATAVETATYNETIRILQREHQGKLALRAGVALAEKEKFEEALKKFDEAESLLGNRPGIGEWAEKLQNNRSKVLQILAEGAWNEGRYAPAKEYARSALDANSDNEEAQSILVAEIPADPPYWKSDTIVQRNISSDEYLKVGKEAYAARDYGKAEEMFENVLYDDPWNRDAIRFLKKVAEKKLAFNEEEQEYTAAHRMQELKKRWLRGLGERHAEPPKLDQPTKRPQDSVCDELSTKMESIIIKELEFKNADIEKVIEFLVQYARSLETDINIVVDLKAGDAGTAAAADATPTGIEGGAGDDFGFGSDDGFGFGGDAADLGLEAASPAAASGPTKINMNLRRVNMKHALDIITDLGQLRWRCDKGIIYVRDSNDPGSFDTRFYRVDPSRFIEKVPAGSSGGGGDDFGGFGDDFGTGAPAAASGGTIIDVKDFFIKSGVKFPQGSSITFNSLLGQLTVVNTSENFDLFERVLEAIQVVPQQVEIEARFVEVQQEDIEELGFQWSFLDDVELAVKKGNGPVGSRERVVVNGGGNPITGGLRFFNFSGASGVLEPKSAPLVGQSDVNTATPSTFLGNILSVTGVLTNPELQMVLHALDQSGRSDLLSAPRVTTLNNVNAQIEVVREIIYPTEFEFQDVNQSGNTVQIEGQQAFIPPAIRPESFETRETGVILNVTPSVNPDNYTINLTLIPEIAELVDWIQYGAVFPRPDGGEFVLNIPQPVFDSRNVTTTMIVWDGHTVVMGGLIREDLVTVDDKVPLLGDIPLIGRLFQSKGQRSQKRNLLIFVTARLVNPAGEPIHNAKGAPSGLPGIGNDPENDG